MIKSVSNFAPNPHVTGAALGAHAKVNKVYISERALSFIGKFFCLVGCPPCGCAWTGIFLSSRRKVVTFISKNALPVWKERDCEIERGRERERFTLETPICVLLFCCGFDLETNNKLTEAGGEFHYSFC